MKKAILIVIGLCLFLVAAPAAMAQGDSDWEFQGTWSLGAGAGFDTDGNTAPFVLSGKVWDPSWELGVDVNTVFEDESEDYDQLVQVYLAYRYDLDMGVNAQEGITYVGIGGGAIFEDFDYFGNDFGPIGLIGWDSDVWGLEAKVAWYDPLLAEFVVYYHFE